jgi:hypothetical protein
MYQMRYLQAGMPGKCGKHTLKGWYLTILT